MEKKSTRSLNKSQVVCRLLDPSTPYVKAAIKCVYSCVCYGLHDHLIRLINHISLLSQVRKRVEKNTVNKYMVFRLVSSGTWLRG